ncbi:uncharacterized protein LOC143025354 isoform X1 [Oratosquilla oratoria]|uniref:uncharacterized protein LOC143025354 isoform X1 n=1 Tax=Oratosquilla oratoria TaxID=337810 RepID=UPI003F764380
MSVNNENTSHEQSESKPTDEEEKKKGLMKLSLQNLSKRKQVQESKGGSENRGAMQVIDERTVMTKKKKTYTSGSRQATSSNGRLKQNLSNEQHKKNMELDRLCGAALDAHSGLRLYLLLTMPHPPTASPPPSSIKPLLNNKHYKWLSSSGGH